MSVWQMIDYKKIAPLLLGIAVAGILSQIETVEVWLLQLDKLSFGGALLAGFIYTFSFTAALGVLVMVNLSITLPPLLIALIAALGTALGDYIIFSLVKRGVVEQIKYDYQQIKEEIIIKLHPHRYVRWLLVAIGLIIIASPIPDEIGVGLLGLARIKNSYFIGLTYILNFIGIYLLLSLARWLVN